MATKKGKGIKCHGICEHILKIKFGNQCIFHFFLRDSDEFLLTEESGTCTGARSEQTSTGSLTIPALFEQGQWITAYFHIVFLPGCLPFRLKLPLLIL